MKSLDVLVDFGLYCIKHPDDRFWQALRNWSGAAFILMSDLPPYNFPKEGNLKDTFYAEGKEIR